MKDVQKVYNMKMVIGLTGNYGMGKSFVLSVFRELGAVVLDSDEIVHLLLQDSRVILSIGKILGEQAVKNDGSLDKLKIAEIIFNNSKLRDKIEKLLHPLVFDKVEGFLRKNEGKKQVVVVEVPLLFEGRYQGRFNRTVTVFTTQKTALERLGKGGISRSNGMKRLKAQLPILIKKKKADYLINNNGTKQRTRKQVEDVYNSLLGELG